jgi:GntR family transcriptional regulator
MNQLPVPKYYKLAESLKKEINAGIFQPGDQLTPELELCQTYQMSRGTVRQAVQLLVDEGLLWREQGRGTFVRTPLARSQHFSLSSFNDEMVRQNRQPSTRVLVMEKMPASPTVANRLDLDPDTPVFHIQRLRLADGQPVALETRYLAQSLCPDLLNEDLNTQSLHGLFVNKYHIPLVRMEHVVEVRPLSAELAPLLKATPETSAFYVDRVTFTEKSGGGKMPAVWFQAIYREDNYYIQTQTF